MRWPKWQPGASVLVWLAAIFVIAGILVALDLDPGALAVDIGLLLVLLSVIGIAARPKLTQLLGIKEATAEISLMHSMLAITLAGLALVLLGFLNLMGVIPWWKP